MAPKLLTFDGLAGRYSLRNRLAARDVQQGLVQVAELSVSPRSLGWRAPC
jgi:hypothetical protein